VPIYKVKLSTYQATDTLHGTLDVYHDTISDTISDKLAACTRSMRATAAPLACITGTNPINCLDGQRACGDGASNGFEPFAELDFEDYKPDFNGRMYLFAVNFALPVDEELGSLLFHPPVLYGGDTQANRGWELTVYDDTHNPLELQCQPWNVGSNVAAYSEGLVHVTHACLAPTASDQDYNVLSKTRFIRITLIGEFRQIVLDNIDVFFRAIPETETVNLLPLPPTSVPAVAPAPPDPISPPPFASCEIYENVVFAAWESYVVGFEPCGFTRNECCSKASERALEIEVNAFVISATGCCSLLQVPSDILGSVPTVAYQFGDSATGLLF